MFDYIMNLDEREKKVMKLETLYSFATTDEKAEIIDGTENPISNTYKKNSIPFFLADIETYENTWGAMGAEIEINKYEDGLVVDMKLAIILPNGGMYDQHISFICSGDFEEHNMEV